MSFNNVQLTKSGHIKINSIKSNSTSLVIYGSNGSLGSTVGIQFTHKINSMVYLPKHLEGIFIGILLGDGWLQKSSESRNTRFAIKQGLINIKYTLFVFNLFSHYCQSTPSLRKTKLKTGNIHFGVTMSTRTLPCFNYYYNLFYLNGVKIIPKNIYDFLTPECLAHWIMCDGNFNQTGVVLNTQCFTLSEIDTLVKALTDKYGFKVSSNRDHDNYVILFWKRSIPLLQSIVLPYMHPSMLYKINL